MYLTTPQFTIADHGSVTIKVRTLVRIIENFELVSKIHIVVLGRKCLKYEKYRGTYNFTEKRQHSQCEDNMSEQGVTASTVCTL
jgi:hypothetical protein